MKLPVLTDDPGQNYITELASCLSSGGPGVIGLLYERRPGLRLSLIGYCENNSVRGGNPALSVLVFVADEIQLAGLDLLGHAPVLKRFLITTPSPSIRLSNGCSL